MNQKSPFQTNVNFSHTLSYQRLQVSSPQQQIPRFLQIGEKGERVFLYPNNLWDHFQIWRLYSITGFQVIWTTSLISMFDKCSKLYRPMCKDYILYHEHVVFKNHDFICLSWDKKTKNNNKYWEASGHEVYMVSTKQTPGYVGFVIPNKGRDKTL